MTSSKMFIPDKIKVGYQNRKGTYTGKLAYVIYFDEKGKLRKESSWEGWRDKKIDPNEFKNEPTEGFVLNKGVGGARESWSHWDTRNEYIRVYDPRDFEFEISVANLLFILQETSSIKGKGIEGECVYAWDGTSLVLLPVNCEEYKACKTHTERQSKKISKSDIKEGYTYILKNGCNVMYIGRHRFNSTSWGFTQAGFKHIFIDLDNKGDEVIYIPESGFTRIAECTSTSSSPNYADVRDVFLKSKYYGNIINVVIKETNNIALDKNGYYYTQVLISCGDQFRLAGIRNSSYWNGYDYYTISKSELFTPKVDNYNISIPQISNKYSSISKQEIENFKCYNLFVVTDQGSQIKVM